MVINMEEDEQKESSMSETKFAIAGLVTVAGLATSVMLYSGVGTEQIDMVFGIVVGAIAGIVSK